MTRSAASLAVVLMLALTPVAAAREGSPGHGPAATGRVGCLAVRADRTLESRRADERFIPASVHKLAVAAAALHHLAADYRTVTRVFSGRPLAAGEVPALIVEAAADPTWSRRFFDRGAGEPIAELVRQVVASGVRRVTGDLVVDLSRFPGRAFPPSRAIGDLAFGFAAPTAALAAGDNAVTLRMAPGQSVGAPAVLHADEVEIMNLTVTAPASRHEKGTVDFQSQWHDGRLVVRGEYPISEPPYSLEIGVVDGEKRAAHLVLQQLRAAGVEVAGGVRLSASPVPHEGQALAELRSPPLADWLPEILAQSRNWHAEMLLRVLAAESTGEGRLDDGLELLAAFLVETVGIEEAAVAFDDASGISPHNLWTPRAVARLLTWVWQQPWRETFLAGLARPGRGTLESWPRLPPGTFAKTGTSRHTDALAGFLVRESAPPTVFVCLSNQSLDPHPANRRRIAEQVWRWHRIR